MSALGSLVVRLALDYAQYTRGLSQSDQEALRFAQNVQRNFDRAGASSREFLANMAKTAIGAVAAFASVNAVVEQMGRSIDSLAALDDLTQKTGSSVENLSRLQQVASAFGADMGAVDGALIKLSKGMAGVDDETNKTHKALTALGVSSKDAAGKLRDPSEVLVDVAKHLQNYEDGAAKAALINDIFGKSGADLLPYLNDVAESVDKFTGVSAEAAAEAARYQDQLGLLKVRYENMSVAVTGAALPALNDLIGAFSDTLNAENDLDKGKAAEWADDLAVGIARVIDVAKILPGIFSAVTGSLKAVSADTKFLVTAAVNLNPAIAAAKLARGGSPLEDLKAALAERNAVLDDANRRYDELWNKPANLMEQAVLARIAARGNAAAAGAAAPAGDKATLKYTAGTEKKAEKDDYDALNKALQEKIALTQQALDSDRTLTEAERQIAAITRGRAEGTINLTDKEAKLLESGLMQLSLNQQLLISRGESDRLEKEALETNQKKVAAAFESVDAMQAEIDNYGKLPEQITRATIAKLEQRKASLEANGGLQTEIDTTEALIVANERLAALQGKKTQLDKGSDVANAKELLDVMSSLDEVAQSAAAGMAKSFVAVGSAIGGITTAVSGYGKAQAAVAAQLAVSLKEAGPDQAKIFKANAAAASQSAQVQVRSYGDMAGAGKAFFKEHTAGYAAMDAVEKSFRAVEMAMAIENMLAKSGLLTAFTGLFVASKATETAADTAATGTSVVNSGIRAAADGIAAFAKTLASIPFPFNIAAGAAVVALLAGMGVKIAGGGGGGGVSSAQRQERQGTGSVFGDANAKSDSINRSLEEVAKNSDIDLSYTQGMLLALRSIDSSLSGLGNLLVRQAGLTGEAAPGGGSAAENLVNNSKFQLVFGGVFGLALNKLDQALGGWGGKLASSVFGGKTTALDTGFTINKTNLGSAASGNVTSNQYTDIKKDGGWFHSDKYSTQTNALGAEADAQFAKVLANLGAGVSEAAKLLGLGGTEFTDRLNSFVIDIGKVSLKDMKGDEIQKALEAVFSKVGDDLARFGVGGLEQFQQVGEGYLETLTRIASNYANLDSILAASGTTFGQTGLASIAARERLIAMSGGIDALASKSQSFNENFLTQAQRLAPVQKYVTEQLGAMGYAGIDTRDKFRDAVLGLANSGALATEAGAKTYAGLLGLADAFAQVYAASENLSKSQEEIADEQKSLQQQYNELTMTSAELRALERAGISASNLALFDSITALQKAADAADKAAEAADKAAGERNSLQQQYNALTMSAAELRALERAGISASNLALFDSITALQQVADAADKAAKAATDAAAKVEASKADLATAYEREANALKGVIKAKQDEAEATRKQMDALKLGAGSILSPEQKLAEAQRQFNAAQGAEKNALAGTYLDALRGYYGSTKEYADAYAKVQAALAISAASASSEATIAQQQLDKLDRQVGGLLAIDKSVISVEKAIFNLSRDLLGAGRGAEAGTSQRDVINGLYQQLLGRDGDAAGISFWRKQANSGLSWEKMIEAFKASPEYQGLHGSHRNGLDFVPFDGYRAELHYGERVQTASQVSGERTMNAELVKLLREVVDQLRASNVQRGAVGNGTLQSLGRVEQRLAKQQRELARA